MEKNIEKIFIKFPVTQFKTVYSSSDANTYILTQLSIFKLVWVFLAQNAAYEK